MILMCSRVLIEVDNIHYLSVVAGGLETQGSTRWARTLGFPPFSVRTRVKYKRGGRSPDCSVECRHGREEVARSAAVLGARSVVTSSRGDKDFIWEGTFQIIFDLRHQASWDPEVLQTDHISGFPHERFDMRHTVEISVRADIPREEPRGSLLRLQASLQVEKEEPVDCRMTIMKVSWRFFQRDGDLRPEDLGRWETCAN